MLRMHFRVWLSLFPSKMALDSKETQVQGQGGGLPNSPEISILGCSPAGRRKVTGALPPPSEVFCYSGRTPVKHRLFSFSAQAGEKSSSRRTSVPSPLGVRVNPSPGDLCCILDCTTPWPCQCLWQTLQEEACRLPSPEIKSTRPLATSTLSNTPASLGIPGWKRGAWRVSACLLPPVLSPLFPIPARPEHAGLTFSSH